MPLPSFYQSRENANAWNVVRVAGYGAVIGAFAALFKTLGPLRAAGAARSVTGSVAEIAIAAVVFALLCAGAAALRNFLARRVVWHDGH
jgi:cytochrome c oxidase assembly factor CtaG